MIGRNHKAEDHQTELLLGLEDPRCVRGKMVAGAGHRFALERAFYLQKMRLSTVKPLFSDLILSVQYVARHTTQ